MDKLEKWLRTRPLLLSLLLALFVSYGLTTNGVVSEDAMPFGDGSHYVMRGMKLYGYLHTAQWAKFWDVLTLPEQCLILPHYLIFFLLPQAWASVSSYGVIQAVTNNALLAVGAWMLCRALDRAEWTPALYLFCAMQNLFIDQSYFFFAEPPFVALGMLTLAWQIQAWRDPGWRSSLLAGIGLGMLFWIKPANAILFLATFVLAEISRFILIRFYSQKVGTSPSSGIDLLRHLAGIACGFVPVLALAIVCGGCMAIFRTLQLNEVSGFFSTQLNGPEIFRIFYFPLCLTYFYHTICLTVIFVIAGVVALKENRNRAAESKPVQSVSTFPVRLFLPLLIAYFVLGEYFSFGMGFKSMRFIVIVLPVFWLSIFWALEHWRMRPGLIFLATCTYCLCAFGQILFNSFESGEVAAESYQLDGDWLSRLPPVHASSQSGSGMTRYLLSFMTQGLPEGGKVAVGTEQLFLTSESLTWASSYGRALRGEDSLFEFDNFLTSNGQYCRQSLLGARGILIFVHPSLQYSQAVQDASTQLAKFCGPWTQEGFAKVTPLKGPDDVLVGYFIVTREPLSDARITELIAGSQGTELGRDIEFGDSTERRVTWDEGWALLKRWFQKRTGETAR